MARSVLSTFATVRSEGGLLPPDLLARIAANAPDLKGLSPEEYGLGKAEKLNEAASRSWANVRAYWAAFQAAIGTLAPTERGVTETRDQWLLPLFRELGYGRLTYRQGAEEVDGRRYAISHQAGDGQGLGAPPVHTLSFREELDKLGGRADGTGSVGVRVSPHGLVQEYLNRTDHVWGIVTNGYRLRLLRDNASLSRAAFVEFDLEAMLEGGVYADFVLLFLVLHRSRLPGLGQEPSECWLERWRRAAEEQGTRALDELRAGVEAAIRTLGQGLLEHPANTELRERLISGKLPVQGYYRQLLRLVYRLLFLLAAEERGLLFQEGTQPRKREIYRRHYGVGRLRELVEQRRHADRYDDLWRSLAITFAALRDDASGDAFGLKPLAGGLFGPDSCPDLDGTLVSNHRLLDAVRGLTWFTDRADRLARRVNYRDMDVEELGSVYEGLLELQPVLRTAGDRPSFELGVSGERKSTGSYYTNPGLVRELIASALEPVIADAMARGRTVEEQRRHMLDLKVCDPACGSGHFLLAAARRIGREVARLDAGESEPDPAAARRGVREAIRHCVYGVDLNPLAVDLCKLALWLEAHEPGKPIGFLDHHIRHGNSLVGATDSAIANGVPDGVFEPVTGDDRTQALAVATRNRRERAGQRGFDVHATHLADKASVRRYVASMEAEEETLTDVAAKANAFQRRQGSAEVWRTRLRADLWTAAAFWPLQAGEPEPPTQAAWERLCADPHLLDYVAQGKADAYRGTMPQRTAAMARRLARRHGFFHWELEFEEVFARPEGGFDCVLGNPPWERIKLQEQEFFAARDPEIAGASNAAARRRLIAALATSDEEPKRRLHEAFGTEKRGSETESTFLRKSGRFPLTGRGDVNTYSVFAELMARLLGVRGRAGIIVPTGIATDDTNKHFFGWLVEDGRLAALYDFENREGLFPAVDSRMKFSLLTMAGRSRRAAPFEVAFFLTRPGQLREPGRSFQLDAATINLLNPNTKTCPIFRAERDAELTTRIYRVAPVLVRDGPPEVNPWGIRFMRMFDMSNDSHLFRTRRELEAAGRRLGEDGRFRGDGEVWERVYQGMMFQNFDHRAADVVQSEFAAKRQNQPHDLTTEERCDPFRLVEPMYWVNSKEMDHRLGPYHRGWFIAFANVSSPTNMTTVKTTVLPRVAAGHSVQLMLVDTVLEPAKAAGLASNLNSFCFDWVARNKMGGVNLSYFIVKQLPVLPPETYSSALLDEIVPRVLGLVYTAHDVAPFARDCGYDGPPFSWDEHRRAHLRAELDGIFAHLYGLSRDDFAYVLDTFPIIRRKDEAAFGEYRTKRLCLDAYDRTPEQAQVGSSIVDRSTRPNVAIRAMKGAQADET